MNHIINVTEESQFIVLEVTIEDILNTLVIVSLPLKYLVFSLAFT